MDDELDLFMRDGKTIIHNCFKAVLASNQHIDFLMLPDFRMMVERAQIAWPTSDTFSNAFKYLWEQYMDNVKTNLRFHCSKRLRKFFQMRVFEINDSITRFNYFNELFGTDDALPYFDDIDIANAVNYTYERRDTTNNDEMREHHLAELLDELRWMGAPDDCNINDFVEEKWFESMQMWTEIQRDIHMFNILYKGRRDKPKIKNFAVVPMCSFQRRHIRIDTEALYSILCKLNIIPRKYGLRICKDGSPNLRNITSKEFNHNAINSWNLFFDVEHMEKIASNKNEFAGQICSDGVSVSIMYKKPKVQPVEATDDEILKMYATHNFVYELGIDPGMRTWIAVVRRNIRTKEEVILK